MGRAMADESEMLHFGRIHIARTYTMNGWTLRNIDAEYWLQVQGSLKVVARVNRLVQRTHGIFGFINQDLEY